VFGLIQRATGYVKLIWLRCDGLICPPPGCARESLSGRCSVMQIRKQGMFTLSKPQTHQ